MKLSICIPSFERADYLDWTLDRLELDFPEAEIVVSDDGLTEDLDWVRDRHSTKWINQGSNIGCFPNHRAAILAGSGEYAIYCANDDYLLPEGVATAIAYLDEHPFTSAYIAPCEVWDEVKGTTFWNTWGAPARTFTKSEGMGLFNYLIEHHVWPEHIVYRTPVPLQPRTRAYWCYPDLVDLLDFGPIYFSDKPFYRNLLVHPLDATHKRVQLGNVQCLTFFDEYRAGLEVLAYGLFPEIPHKGRRQIATMIDSFICQRMFNAAYMYAGAGNNLEAEMLLKRITVSNPIPDDEPSWLSKPSNWLTKVA